MRNELFQMNTTYVFCVGANTFYEDINILVSSANVFNYLLKGESSELG